MSTDPRIGRGWADATTESLTVIRGNLLAGLARVAEHAAAGTLMDIPPKRASSAAEAGHTTLRLLVRLDEELAHRTNQAGA